ncbi:MAG: hypothetical protein IKK60_00185 [Clostridia bacterium]|nr:hypothetical protein [Clostridia bacterium]
MKDNDFNMDNLIKFKNLADKIKNISGSEFDEDDFDIDSFKESGFAELFGQILSEQLSEPYELATEEDLYEEIVDNFFILIQELGIDEFNFFRFKSYDYCREIIVDGKEYDLNGEFCHDDLEATEALCAIDCLIADLENNDEETVIKNIEKRINMHNK